MGKKVWMFIAGILANLYLLADPHHPVKRPVDDQTKWVDSVFDKLSEEERLGQLFMVAAYSNKGRDHIDEVEKLIKDYKIGGIIFLKGSPILQANLTNRYQELSKVPLLVAMNAEYGLGMQLDSTLSLPRQLTLGAISDDKIIFQMGRQLARQLSRLGVHMNFAPVVDVSTTEAVLANGDRSFGEDKRRVSDKCLFYMKGLQDGKIIANAKLFPSLGDNNNVNFILPTLSQSPDRLKDVEMYPLRQLIKDSVMSVMMAHISLSGYDKNSNRASTFSSDVIKKVFRKEFGFEGLIFTDALNVKEINKAFKPGEVDLQALLAGNDVLIFSEDIPRAIKKIKGAIKSKTLNQAEVERSVKKILRAKYWANLNHYQPTNTNNLFNDLNRPEDQLLNYNIYSKAITLVENKGGLVPFHILDTLSFASVSIGVDPVNEFQAMLKNYCPIANYTVPNKYASDTTFNNVLKKVAGYKVVVVSFHGMSNAEGNSYGLSPNALAFLEKLKQKTKVVVCVFGNPLSFKFLGQNDHLICAYEDNRYTRELVPQILFGALMAEGSLPITISENYKAGKGIKTSTLGRLRYGIPESEGVDSNILKTIDIIAATAIKNKATPGCQVLVARNGNVIFQKSYGYLAYDSLQPVNNETIYDIASVTKVIATMQAVMFLEERGLLDLDKKASYYLPELSTTNKKNIIIRDILLHQAGLTPFIPHWLKTVTYGGFDPRYYSQEKSERYPLEVARGLYAIKSMPDSVWKWTLKSELIRLKKRQIRHEYKYSDVGFLFLRRIVENIINQPMEDFLDQNFYAPMGTSTLTYKPLDKFPKEKIAPTEDDKDFRRQLLRGTVHDQGAAMVGGVAPHAGIFSSANDLAKIMQMNLQKGYYGGQRYLFDLTLPKFTRRQLESNRRGLGWDKPAIQYDAQTSAFASDKTYGHTGFSGTCTWVDPDKELVYIFLSNRIYPNANNNLLLKEGTRMLIQEVVYKAIMSYNMLHNLP